MPLQILAHRGIRLNKGLDDKPRIGDAFVANTTLVYPGLFMDKSQINFDADIYANTLGAVRTAWQLGYKADICIYGDGVVYHQRYIGDNKDHLIDAMSHDELQRVNLSSSDDTLDDNNRLVFFDDVIKEQVRLRKQGLNPAPRLQLELRKTVNIEKVIGAIMERLMAEELTMYDIRVVSSHYGALKRAKQCMASFECKVRPELTYRIDSDVLNYVHLDKHDVEELKTQAADLIVKAYDKRWIVEDELSQHFPELANMSADQMRQAVISLVNQEGIENFKKRFENFLTLYIGDGMAAGYYLDEKALTNPFFDSLAIPMNTKLGVTESFKEKINQTTIHSRRLRSHAHSVCLKGRNPSQLLRAFLLLDNHAELSLDYPEMIPDLFADIAARGVSDPENISEITLDPTRKVRIDNMSFTSAQLQFALKRFFGIIGISAEEVKTTESHARKITPKKRDILRKKKPLQ